MLDLFDAARDLVAAAVRRRTNEQFEACACDLFLCRIGHRLTSVRRLLLQLVVLFLLIEFNSLLNKKNVLF